MAKTYLISTTYFKENSVVNLNVEDQLINMSIIDAQEIHIQNTLGTKLYKKIISMVKDGSITNGSVYQTLLDDYIVDALVKWTLVETLPYIHSKIMNKSVSTQTSDNSTPLSIEDLKYHIEQHRNKAEYKTQRMADYLCANSTLYPEYTQATTIDDIVPQHNAYFSGVVMDEYEDERRYRRVMGINNNKTLNW